MTLLKCKNIGMDIISNVLFIKKHDEYFSGYGPKNRSFHE